MYHWERIYTTTYARAKLYLYIYVYNTKMNILTFHCNCLLFKECWEIVSEVAKRVVTPLMYPIISDRSIDCAGTKAHSLGNTKCCQFNKYQTFFNTVLFFCVVNINSVLDVFLLLYSLSFSVSI